MSREKEERKECERLRQHTRERIAEGLERLDTLLETLITILVAQLPKRAKSATLVIQDAKGKTVDLTVHLNDNPGIAMFDEWSGLSGTGIKVPPVGAVSYTSSDPTVATVDSATGQLAYVKEGTTTISGADAGNTLTASAVLTVSAAVAKSATLTLEPGA